jgi:hypothetical protein
MKIEDNICKHYKDKTMNYLKIYMLNKIIHFIEKIFLKNDLLYYSLFLQFSYNLYYRKVI